jgi:hypothetical protein
MTRIRPIVPILLVLAVVIGLLVVLFQGSNAPVTDNGTDNSTVVRPVRTPPATPYAEGCEIKMERMVHDTYLAVVRYQGRIYSMRSSDNVTWE